MFVVGDGILGLQIAMMILIDVFAYHDRSAPALDPSGAPRARRAFLPSV
jgi:hypothetical protein